MKKDKASVPTYQSTIYLHHQTHPKHSPTQPFLLYSSSVWNVGANVPAHRVWATPGVQNAIAKVPCGTAFKLNFNNNPFYQPTYWVVCAMFSQPKLSTRHPEKARQFSQTQQWRVHRMGEGSTRVPRCALVPTAPANSPLRSSTSTVS